MLKKRNEKNKNQRTTVKSGKVALELMAGEI